MYDLNDLHKSYLSFPYILRCYCYNASRRVSLVYNKLYDVWKLFPTKLKSTGYKTLRITFDYNELFKRIILYTLYYLQGFLRFVNFGSRNRVRFQIKLIDVRIMYRTYRPSDSEINVLIIGMCFNFARDRSISSLNLRN